MQDKDVVKGKEGKKRKNDHKLKTPDSKNETIHKKASNECREHTETFTEESLQSNRVRSNMPYIQRY